jgi:hypothetical protein
MDDDSGGSGDVGRSGASTAIQVGKNEIRHLRQGMNAKPTVQPHRAQKRKRPPSVAASVSEWICGSLT